MGSEMCIRDRNTDLAGQRFFSPFIDTISNGQSLFQRQHILSTNVVNSFGEFFGQLIGQGSYDHRNFDKNGVWLPTGARDGAVLDASIQRGSHNVDCSPISGPELEVSLAQIWS